MGIDIDMMQKSGAILVSLEGRVERELRRQAVELLAWRLAQDEIARIEALPESPQRAAVLRALRDVERPETDALQLLLEELL